ncbi:MAG: SMC family ATPase, partial [Bacteroidales bacterium]|nr:SMC family ATPase [Bacteroidales bacterium]
KKYRAIREYRRNGRNFNDVRLHDTTFYNWVNDDWIPLEHTNAETIIGLSETNFKRTIIIPQGKFREFIELKGTDRTNMMKELFNLHHYDLYGNARSLLNSNNLELNILDGKLSEYDNLSDEIITEKEKQHKEQKSTFNKNLSEHKKLSKTFDLLKQLNVDFNSLQMLNKKLASEESRKKEIEEQEKSLKLYETIHQQFDEILRLKKQFVQRIEIQKKSLSDIAKELTDKQEQSGKVSSELSELKPFIDSIEIKKQEVADLELIAKILTYRAAIIKGIQRTTKGRDVVGNLSQQVEVCTKTIIDTDVKIENTRSKLIDAKTLTAIELWFYNHNALTKHIDERRKRLIDIGKQISENNKKFEEIGYSKENWKEIIEQKNNRLDKQLVEANNQKTQLEVKQQIAQFADEIHDGSACPLCGSFEHPHVIETEDVSSDILNNKKKLESLEQQSELNASHIIELTRLEEASNTLIKSKKDVDAKLNSFEEEREKHLSLFVWKDFSYLDEAAFKAKKIVNDKLNVEREELDKNQKENSAQLEQISKKLTEAKELLRKIEDENKHNETLITSSSEQIKHLQLEDFEHLTADDINKTKIEKDKLIKNKQEEHRELEKQQNELLQTIAAQKATKREIVKQLEQLNKEQKENNAIIDTKLDMTAFKSIGAIEQLLSNKRNVEAERTLIEGFKIEHAKLKQSIEELEKRLEGKSFSPEEFETKQKEFEESEVHVNKLRETLATLKHDLERIKEEYKKKKELLVEKEKLESRKANISILTQLFTASGFVNYVSSIYLKNLCAIANERFHRLTKNQLSLQINDKNEFEIVDYLNDGRSRSVRTLSGGQNFQVSLSLALALAENVQSLTNSDKNFFFIDEGFGTQDAESVNIVFETLNNLQKGNRIVGIISHVEELQERIPKSLFIRKDLEEGSLIEIVE